MRSYDVYESEGEKNALVCKGKQMTNQNWYHWWMANRNTRLADPLVLLRDLQKQLFRTTVMTDHATTGTTMVFLESLS